MNKSELQTRTRQIWLWTFFFSYLALFHSLWTGWLAPLGIFLASPLFKKQQFLGLQFAILRIMATLVGIAVGYIDAQLLGVAPTVGTAFLITLALTCLGESVSASELSERQRFNLLGFFLGTWAGSFLLITMFGEKI
jgi:hypothetical protein